jgi:DNA-binding transcriptional LysR family regulator
MWMVDPQNPLAKQEAVSVAEIARHPILLPKTGYTRRLMDKLLRPHESDLQIRMELPSVGMIKSFVAAGLGVSLVSASFARDQVLAGRVKLIALKERELWRELGLAYRRDRTLTQAARTFITSVRQLAATSR